MPEMPRWEYQHLTLGSDWKKVKPEELDEVLAELGEDGWEVVSVYTHHGSNKTNLLAKRPLSGRPPRERSWPG
jgi:hypothetical protein